MNGYNEIRQILGRWYDGDSTPADQKVLEDFFAANNDLPEDLALERDMFLGLLEAGENYGELPMDVSDRIESAVEAEMAREQAVRGRKSTWRRRFITGCAVAACLALVVTISIRLSINKSTNELDMKMAVNEQMQPKNTDSIIKIVSEPLVAPQLLASADTCIKKGHVASVKKRPVYIAPKIEEKERGVDMYLTPEEERLVAANYHVVTDEREANAILGAVFVRLESGMTEEEYRISDVSARYEMEMNDMYNL